MDVLLSVGYVGCVCLAEAECVLGVCVCGCGWAYVCERGSSHENMSISELLHSGSPTELPLKVGFAFLQFTHACRVWDDVALLQLNLSWTLAQATVQGRLDVGTSLRSLSCTWKQEKR